MGVDGRGDAIAVWDEITAWTAPGASFDIKAALRPAGGAWRSPVRIGSATGISGLGGVSSPEPSLAVDPRGDAVVVWVSRASPSSSSIRAAVGSVGGAWSEPVTVSGGDMVGARAQVALDGRGNALAVWSSFSGRASGIRASSKPAGSSWRKPVTVMSGGGPQGALQVSFDLRGNAIVVWEQTYLTGGSYRDVILAAFKPAGGAWRPAVEVGPGNTYRGGPQVAFDARGNAIVVWVLLRGLWIEAAFRPAGGNWRKPVTLARERGEEAHPQVAFDPHGNATAIWGYHHPRSSTSVIHAAFRPTGGGWTRPVLIAAGAGSWSAPDLVIDRHSNALAIWSENGGAVLATMRPARRSWQKPLAVSPGSGCAGCAFSPVDAAFDSHGNAVAVWATFFGRFVVQAASFTPDPTTP